MKEFENLEEDHFQVKTETKSSEKRTPSGSNGRNQNNVFSQKSTPIFRHLTAVCCWKGSEALRLETELRKRKKGMQVEHGC